MLPFNTGDCLIEVTAWTDLTVIYCFYLFRREPTQLQVNLMKREKRLEKLRPKKTGPERDVATQYFGEFLDPLDVFQYKSTEDAIRF